MAVSIVSKIPTAAGSLSRAVAASRIAHSLGSRRASKWASNRASKAVQSVNKRAYTSASLQPHLFRETLRDRAMDALTQNFGAMAIAAASPSTAPTASMSAITKLACAHLLSRESQSLRAQSTAEDGTEYRKKAVKNEAYTDSFEGKVIQLGPNFSDRMTITLDNVDSFLSDKVLQKFSTQVYKTNNTFDFFKNGFEFIDFRGTQLSQAIETLANGPTSWIDMPQASITNHATAVENALSQWGQKQGLQFRHVVWIDTVYRNTAGGKFGAVHFVHADFPAINYSSEDYASTLKGHSDWKERVTMKLGAMSTEMYEKLHVSKIVNIWMPLDKKIVAEPLAIMDIHSLGDPKESLRVYQDVRANGGTKYYSVSVLPRVGQRWYIKDNMKRGEAIVFDSCQTPHTAVSLPDQGNKTRRSVECRVIFLK